MSIADDLDPGLIEKAARAAHQAAPDVDNTAWDDLRDWQQSMWRTIAYATIDAVAADLWDEAADHLESRYDYEAAFELRLANPYREEDQ